MWSQSTYTPYPKISSRSICLCRGSGKCLLSSPAKQTYHFHKHSRCAASTLFEMHGIFTWRGINQSSLLGAWLSSRWTLQGVLILTCNRLYSTLQIQKVSYQNMGLDQNWYLLKASRRPIRLSQLSARRGKGGECLDCVYEQTEVNHLCQRFKPYSFFNLTLFY